MPVLALLESAGVHSRWAFWLPEAAFFLLVAGGFILGCISLGRMRREEYKHVLWRAVTGVCLNGGFLWMLLVALAHAFNDGRPRGNGPVSIGRELEPGAGLKASLAHNIKLQAAFEKAALQKSNNLTLLAGPAIDFLRNEDQVLSNFYDTAKPLMRQPVLDMANIKSEDDLEKRKTLLLQYLDASGCASNYYRNVENDFHAMAIKGGLPDATVEKQTKRLRTNLNKMSQLPAIWETNDRWARSELRALGFLGSNWQSWSYDVSLRKTVFKDEKVRTEFNRMVAEINTVDRQRKQLQQQLQQNLQQNPIR